MFTTAKKNLIANFKARFILNSLGEDYIFYTSEYSRGFACTVLDYEKYLLDFTRFLKQGTWILSLWLFMCIVFMLWYEATQDFEFNIFTGGILFLMPYPFLLAKAIKVYNAPKSLVKKTQPVVRPRNRKQIQDARIKGMSWRLLNLTTLVPLIGVYIFLTDTSLQDWQITLGIGFFITVSSFGIYLGIRKWRL